MHAGRVVGFVILALVLLAGLSPLIWYIVNVSMQPACGFNEINAGFSRQCRKRSCSKPYQGGPNCEICSGHGEPDSFLGSGNCSCSDGYAGKQCATCAINYTRSKDGLCVAD